MKLSESTAIVTGAGSGMGRAIALALAAEGCRVVAVGRRADKLAETVSLDEKPGRIVARAGDVGDRAEAARIVDQAIAEFGPIAILVNSAGVNVKRRALAELSLDDWDYMVRVNLTGAFHMIRAVLPSMRVLKDGLIVNISSVAGVRPSPLGGVAYTASKFGMNGMSGVVALEEAKNGIRCTAICPGEVATPLLDERPVPVSPERRAQILQPEDVAAAVLFVAKLAPRAHVPEMILKPTNQEFA